MSSHLLMNMFCMHNACTHITPRRRAIQPKNVFWFTQRKGPWSALRGIRSENDPDVNLVTRFRAPQVCVCVCTSLSVCVFVLVSVFECYTGTSILRLLQGMFVQTSDLPFHAWQLQQDWTSPVIYITADGQILLLIAHSLALHSSSHCFPCAFANFAARRRSARILARVCAQMQVIMCSVAAESACVVPLYICLDLFQIAKARMVL
jgi:hypothetical protein